MRIRLLILCIAVLCLSAVPAIAAIGGPPGTALQLVLDAPLDYDADGNIDNPYGILRSDPDPLISPLYPSSSVNVTTDYVPDSIDSWWGITASGSSTTTMIVELASFASSNILGIYDPMGVGPEIPLFIGSNVAGDQRTLSIKDDGSIWLDNVDTTQDYYGNLFGWYLDSSTQTGGGKFYSDTSLNTDGPGGIGYDHMYAYQGKDVDLVKLPTLNPAIWTDNEYVLAFEDLDGGTDGSGSDWDFTDMVVMVESVFVPVPAAVILGILGIGVAGLKLRKYA